MHRGPRAATFCALALLACGAPAAGEDAGVEACTPRTCASAGAECGTLDDGCGARIECGACAAHQTCGLERPNACGGECTTDAHCARGSFCDTASSACTTACRGPSTRSAIDIAPARVELVVTLDGGPLPVIESAEEQAPALLLFGSDPFLDLRVLRLYERVGSTDEWAPRERITLSLLPGEYLLSYAGDIVSGAFADHWPFGSADLQTIRVRDDVVVEVDVPRVRASIDATLDGSPAPPGARFDAERAGSRPFAGGTYWPLPLSERWLVPGEYTVGYRGGPEPWPVGRWQVSVTIDGGPVVIDVPSVTVAFDVTLAGTPVTGPAPPFELLLPGELLGVEIPAAGGSVVPGTYELRLTASPADSEWPASRATLDPALEITSDGVIAVDVARARVDATVLLDGAPVPPSPCGHVVIGSWPLLATGGATPQSAWLVPGRYGIRYFAPRCDGIDPEWPMTANDLGEVTVSDGDSIVVDVPRVRAIFETTLAGGPLPALGIADGPAPPALEIVSSADVWERLRLPLYERIDGVLGPLPEHAAWVSPGLHDVGYFGGGPAPEYREHWPAGAGWLRRGIDLRSDATVAIDVPRTRVDLAVTLGGGPFAPVAYEDRWWEESFRGVGGPEIALGRPSTFGLLDRVDFQIYPEDDPSLDPLLPVDRRTAWVLPGTYAVRFQVGRVRPGFPPPSEWPMVGGDLGCWTVP